MTNASTVVWSPAAAPPAELAQHPNAAWSPNERYLLLTGCKNCETSLTAHSCDAVDPIDFVVFDRERGVNQSRVDALVENAKKSKAPAPATVEIADESKESALKIAARDALSRGFHIFGLQPGKKGTLAGSHGFKDAKSSSDVLQLWDEIPDANIGIATGESDLCVLDFDIAGSQPAWIDEIKTYKVSTARGLHVYFWGARPGKDLYVDGKHVGEIKSIGGYVLAAGSVHPDGPLYTVVDNSQVADAPERIAELLKEGEKTPITASANGPKIPYGNHDKELTRIAGKLRHAGLEEEGIYNSLVEVCEKRCENYGSDYKEMCRKIAHSIGKKPIRDESVLFRGELSGTNPDVKTQDVVAEERVPAPQLPTIEYPAFPLFAIEGTSLYENFVKPICDVNSRIPYFMWFPAMTVMLNYLGTKVHVAGKNLMPTYFVILIGQKGRAIKSSSVESAIRYLSEAGIVNYASLDSGMAQGKSLVWSAGSPEGLALDMHKTNCKNPVLYYDELKHLVSKAGIDGSSFKAALLTIYESGNLQNVIKSKKESYGLLPGTYCGSLIACTTPKNFSELWSVLSYGSEGLDDRFTFVFQPEVLPAKKPETVVPVFQNAVKTKTLIDKALQRGTFTISDDALKMLEDHYARRGVSNRVNIRALKLAFYFAVDLGRDEIDEDCVERAIAICDYEIAVKKYFPTTSAQSKLAAAQLKLRLILQRQKNGRMRLFGKNGLLRAMGSDSYDTSFWYVLYQGLIKSGHIREEEQDGDKIVQLMLPIVNQDEDDD